jgi:predicted SnoaL-like aldol condensation-catalyzing enzyme
MRLGLLRGGALAGLSMLLLAGCVTEPRATFEPVSPAPSTPRVEATEAAAEPAQAETAIEAPVETGASPDEALAALARERLEQRNAATVIAFYELIFQDHRVAEAFDRYAGDVYVQHNPGAADGREAVEAFLVPFFEANPMARSEIRRAIAQGDLVALHVHAKSNPIDPGRAVVEIFRVQNGAIVEHWDVIQPIPVEAANDNTMF